MTKQTTENAMIENDKIISDAIDRIESCGGDYTAIIDGITADPIAREACIKHLIIGTVDGHLGGREIERRNRDLEMPKAAADGIPW
jgi:hypothetical protein